jgi:hypothetical protein
MSNGDPTVFGLPCRFPAGPSVRLANRLQDFDPKRFFGAEASREKIFP